MAVVENPRYLDDFLEGMNTATYREEVDSQFVFRPAKTPVRVNSNYFFRESHDILPRDLLRSAYLMCCDYMPMLAGGHAAEAVFVVGRQTDGTYTERTGNTVSAIDIYVVADVDFETAIEASRSLTKILNRQITDQPYTKRDGTETVVNDIFHVIVRPVKPYGTVYDIVNQRFVTCDKTVADFSNYLWHVEGIRQD